jgi:hypothetical protein
MATYKDIQAYVRQEYGYTVKTCWIAHVKEMCGLERRDAPNREDATARKHPCPPQKVDSIKHAFKYFGLISFR